MLIAEKKLEKLNIKLNSSVLYITK